jgi:hypothetical protein
MTTEAKTETGNAGNSDANANPNAASNQSQAKTFTEQDVSAIVSKQVKEAITNVEGKALKTVTSKIVSALSGEEEKKATNPIHKGLVENPEGFLTEFATNVVTEAVRTVRNDLASQTETKAALDEIHEEYPELQKLPNELFAEAEQTDNKLSIRERVKKGAEKLAQRLDIKKKSERSKDDEVSRAASGPRRNVYSSDRPGDAPAVKDLNQSADSYLIGRQAAFDKARGITK